MNLILFDLDNTLLADDSDYLWGHFLIDKGLVEADVYERENERFYAQYKAGTLDIHAYQRFSLQPLLNLPPAQLAQLQIEFVQTRIQGVVAPAARGLIELHKARGDQLLIITATNRLVTQPIATALGIDDLLATDPAYANGRMTGEIEGVPCFQDGKIKRLRQWLAAQALRPTRSWFYSDSHNDLPLLRWADAPVAVDPDEILRQTAEQSGWPVVSLRHHSAEEVFSRVAGDVS